MIPPSASGTRRVGFGRANSRAWLAIALLGACGYALNVCNLPLFAGVVQFLFGTVAVLVALETFGIAVAFGVAFIASLHTFVLWQHPWAIPFLLLEPLIVGALRKRTDNLVLADAVFWFGCGMPLSYLLYHTQLRYDTELSLLITFKNGVNGLLNALIASLLLFSPLLRRAPRALQQKRDFGIVQPSFALLLFNLLVGAAIVPALCLTLRHSWLQMREQEAEAARITVDASRQLGREINAWAQARSEDFWMLNRAGNEAAVSRFAQMLSVSRPDFVGFAIHDPRLNTATRALLCADVPVLANASDNIAGGVAFNRALATRVDVQRVGQLAARTPVNVKFALSRPAFVRLGNGERVSVIALQAPLLLSDVGEDASNGSSPRRIVALLRLDALQTVLRDFPTTGDLRAFALSRDDQVFASSDERIARVGGKFEGLSPESGIVTPFGNGSARWWPTVPRRPVLRAWAESSFFARAPASPDVGWTVLVEEPFAARQRGLVRGFGFSLALILALASGAMLLALILSRRLSQPLASLAALSTDLPRKLRDHDASPVTYPDASLREIAHLTGNVRDMEAALRANFDKVERSRAKAEAARREAEEANRLKDEFLAVLSHELRTPLVPILGYCDLLQMDGVDEQMVKEGASVIQRNAHAQSALIEDLLDVSRIVAGKMTLKIGLIDVPQLLSESIESLRFNAGARQISITLESGDDVPRILADPTRLRQIISNLLNNALKFTPDGGRVRVGVEALENGERVRIGVSDNGKGIAPEFLPHIFDRFRQANHDHNTRSAGGLGLGLAIVRHLVELHGGEVEARSEGVGCGAQFLVTLPRNAFQSSGEDEGLSDDAPDVTLNGTTPAKSTPKSSPDTALT